MQVYGDFVMTTHVRFMHMNDMDQAGLMVRLNSTCWLKACVTNHPTGAFFRPLYAGNLETGNMVVVIVLVYSS